MMHLGYLVTGALPDGQWWRFLYCSLLNFLSLLVCLIGATMFAKTSVVILAIVCMCLLSAIISFLIEDPKECLWTEFVLLSAPAEDLSPG
uniref:Uncharacterized protein n=1 Tax=Timema douglasi TaxID=61478 RepID=A0A7R8Z712_TIMDO|nr:unnamed protein product [Timema douglasi]